MGIGGAVPSDSLVSENELVVPEGKCKLANGPPMELFYQNQQERVLEMTLYFVLSESWTTLELPTSRLLDPDDGILVLASA